MSFAKHVVGTYGSMQFLLLLAGLTMHMGAKL